MKEEGGLMLEKHLVKFLGKARRYISYSVLFMMVRTFGTVLLAFAFARAVESYVEGQEIGIFTLSLFVLVGLILRIGALYAVTILQAEIVGQVKSSIRYELVQKAANLGPAYREHTSTSDLISMASDTTEQLENYYGRFLPQYYGAFAESLVIFAVLAFNDLSVAWLFLVLAPIIPLFLRFLLDFVTKRQETYIGRYQDVGHLFLDSVQGLSTLRVFQADAERGRDLDHKSEEFRIETMKLLAMQLNSITLIEWLAYGGGVACVIMAAKHLMVGAITLSQMVLILILAFEAFRPMLTLTSSFHVAMTGVTAGKQLIKFLNLPEETAQDLPGNIKFDAIRMDHLSYQYADSTKPALEDISTYVMVNKGYTAIVGPSGSGKSTLAQLIAGQINEHSGQLSIGSFDYKTFTKKSLAPYVVRISHDSYLFEETVRENLQMGHKEPLSEQTMHTVLELVGLDTQIQERGGLDMTIQSGGANLSGGQRQRLALARALLYEAQVYIFDEACSSIDAESEAIIHKVIEKLAEDKSVIVITHRLKTIVHANKILVLEKGKLVEEGDHRQLMRINGLYARLFKQQAQIEQVNLAKSEVTTHA